VNREQVLATTGDAPKAERVDAVSRFAEMLRSANRRCSIGTPMRVEKCTGLVCRFPVDISPFVMRNAAWMLVSFASDVSGVWREKSLDVNGNAPSVTGFV
jgi:hypothetical protein